MPTPTSHDSVLHDSDGVEIQVDPQGKTIARFVSGLLNITPYSALFDSTSVDSRRRVDIYGYAG